jgi:hypothetical protein
VIATIDQTTHLFSLRQTRYDEFCEQVELYMRGIDKQREFLDLLVRKKKATSLAKIPEDART